MQTGRPNTEKRPIGEKNHNTRVGCNASSATNTYIYFFQSVLDVLPGSRKTCFCFQSIIKIIFLLQKKKSKLL